ncbi:hypothetical protein GCM10010441_39630 [Kitasatospora paracochleata]|uniref:Uncharacterized protein n=1 Tax=Kitasatospora paracochleata TaxID=58354 RepID=A0ABT1IW11_9ACTN|nr:hypothetical protein [Kitasatospora paracochleata]MCP2309317.1 hypothetical protein [Kitasatospora paracochleata]
MSITALLAENDHDLFFDIAVPIHQHPDAMSDYRWRSWGTEHGEDEYRCHYEPDGNRPALLTTTVVRIPAADLALPAPVGRPGDHQADGHSRLTVTAWRPVRVGRAAEGRGHGT